MRNYEKYAKNTIDELLSDFEIVSTTKLVTILNKFVITLFF